MLRAALATATTRKRAHLVIVTGEAGVGKTRLASELGKIAECEQGARVLNGQCIPYGETNVWWPIAAMVAEACEVDLTDPDAKVPTCTRAAVRTVLGIDDDDPEVGRVTEGLLYLMREGGPSEGSIPRAREEGLRAALAFFAGLAPPRSRSSSSSPISIGVTMSSSSSSPGCSCTSRPNPSSSSARPGPS